MNILLSQKSCLMTPKKHVVNC